jgi:hypothetical protein
MVWIETILICPECGAHVDGPMVSVVELRRAGHDHDNHRWREPRGPGVNTAEARLARYLEERKARADPGA